MERATTEWKLHAVVADGEPLIISGVDVWASEWEPTAETPLVVPHPNYPSQEHELQPYRVFSGNHSAYFAAGELSNNVWCFYVHA